MVSTDGTYSRRAPGENRVSKPYPACPLLPAISCSHDTVTVIYHHVFHMLFYVQTKYLLILDLYNNDHF